jgi:F0F1-type ATP synthase assembly protein I
MDRVEIALRGYIQRLGQDKTASLGGKQKTPTEADTQFLISALQTKSKENGTIIIVAVILLFALFCVGIGFAIYFRDSPAAISSVLGGNLLVLLGIVAWLRRLWFDKNTMDTLMLIIPGLSASEAAKVVTSFYFRAVKVKSPTGGGKNV